MLAKNMLSIYNLLLNHITLSAPTGQVTAASSFYVISYLNFMFTMFYESLKGVQDTLVYEQYCYDVQMLK